METEITIGKTIEWYNALRDDVAGKTVREMFDSARKCAKEGEFVSNDTYFHALFLSEIMFSNAEKSLRILSGCDVVRFLETLRSAFINCCRKIANNGGTVSIVALTPSKYHFETCKNNLQRFFNEVKRDCPSIDGKIQGLLKVLPKEMADSVINGTNNTLSHYIVADSKMVRIESPHGILEKENPASSIKAKVFFNAPNLAGDIANSFDKSYFAKHATK